MSILFGPLLVFALVGASSLVLRSLKIPFSILGAFAAIVRRTDSPRLQRRQALVLLLLAGGLIGVLVGSVLLAAGTITTSIVATTVVGGLLLTLSGHLGAKTLRAIGREERD